LLIKTPVKIISEFLYNVKYVESDVCASEITLKKTNMEIKYILKRNGLIPIIIGITFFFSHSFGEGLRVRLLKKINLKALNFKL